MKLLMVVSVVQLAAVLFLLNQVFSLKKTLQVYLKTAAASVPLEQKQPRQMLSSLSEPVFDVAAQEQVRIIIRQELSGLARSADTSNPDFVEPPNPSHSAHAAMQLEAVQRSLDTHLADGYISPADMNKLQQNIARLDQENRQQMLRQLVRALNTGELDGEL